MFLPTETDSDGFQLVTHQKSHKKCHSKKKRLNLSSLYICSSKLENTTSDLAHLVNSVENYRLELAQSGFRTDFAARATEAGISHIKREGAEDELLMSNTPIKQVVSYGIGNYSTCPIARYQFAFLSLLCELLRVDKKNCFLYDPQFSSLEKEGVLKVGYQLISVNEECKRRSEEKTLFFMPHCDKSLYNNLIWANWDPILLTSTIIVGNSFTSISESMPEKHFSKDLQCLSKAMQLMTEFSIPNTFRHTDIFNNTSIHIFCDRGNSVCKDKFFWSKMEEPKFEGDEVIPHEKTN